MVHWILHCHAAEGIAVVWLKKGLSLCYTYNVSNTLVRIKRAVLAGHYAFSEKASVELEADSERKTQYKDMSNLWQ